MEAEKFYAPEPEGVVGTHGAGFSWIDANLFLHAMHVSGPNGSRSVMHNEVEPGIAVLISHRFQRERSIRVCFRPHHYDGTAVGQREDDFDEIAARPHSPSRTPDRD